MLTVGELPFYPKNLSVVGSRTHDHTSHATMFVAHLSDARTRSYMASPAKYLVNVISATHQVGLGVPSQLGSGKSHTARLLQLLGNLDNWHRTRSKIVVSSYLYFYSLLGGIYPEAIGVVPKGSTEIPS
jgi:hypothetical protein